VIVDRSHRVWAVAAGASFFASLVGYVAYARSAPEGPRGGSGPGLAFGIAGTLLILFAALFGLRKRVPHWRVGRAAAWLKGHLWLGALSYPLIFFHAGFRYGGALTTVMMVCFSLVFLSGAFGLLLQQYLPRLMMRSLPQETVYEQIDHVRGQLWSEAEALVAGGGGAVPKAKSTGAFQGRVVEARAGVEAREGVDRAPLVRFLEGPMREFFEADAPRRSPLWTLHARSGLFRQLRLACAPELHPVARDLEALCDQRAQLEMQRRLHHWLHGWLFVHAPLSWALVVLTLFHAVMALRY
jgi:hypothetical protein